MSVSRAERAVVPATPAQKRRARRRPLGNVTRTLGAKAALLLLVFALVPIILYSEFRHADEDKRNLLLKSARDQGRLIAESLRPLLLRESPSPLPEVNAAIKPLSTREAGIKVLFRPSDKTGPEGFYFVASEPPVPEVTLAAERARLIERGVLGALAQSCAGEIPVALRHTGSGGEAEILTSITPVTTPAGCWAVITTHSAREMLGTAIDRPYWQTLEVRLAGAIYVAMALLTFGLFFSIWRGLMRFRDLARGIGSGKAGGEGFAARNEVPELAEVAQEFDRMTGALRDSADSLRRAAEDNAHAFKTPIAILRQSAEPLKRAVPEDNARGRRALDVIEESLDRLDQLVTSARRLDQATAEVLDAPRQRVDLSQLLERMLAAYATTLAERGLRLQSSLAPGIAVRAGDDLMETVIENVVDNAVGIAPPDTAIEVELKRDGAWAVVAVRDRGPGVAQDDLERIFDRYISLRGSDAGDGTVVGAVRPAPEGAHMGIGLWIVRRNIEAVGGQVVAENRLGGGLTVVIHLPLAG